MWEPTCAFFLISSDESHSGGSGFEGMYQKYIAEQLFASIRGQRQTVFDTFQWSFLFCDQVLNVLKNRPVSPTDRNISRIKNVNSNLRQ